MRIKRFIITSTICCILMTVPSLSVFAATPAEAKKTQEQAGYSIMPRDYCNFQCNGSNVNVRKGPGTSYASITKLQKGDSGTIIDYNYFDREPTWAKVSFYRDKKTYEGWVAIQYLDLSELR